jgi:hypothetical protein
VDALQSCQKLQGSAVESLLGLWNSLTADFAGLLRAKYSPFLANEILEKNKSDLTKIKQSKPSIPVQTAYPTTMNTRLIV